MIKHLAKIQIFFWNFLFVEGTGSISPEFILFILIVEKVART